MIARAGRHGGAYDIAGFDLQQHCARESMDRPLFVYGTLSDPDLLAAVLGRRVGRASMLAATAPGFRAVHLPQRVYPALVRAPGGQAAGLLILHLTGFERDVLDAFEGEEYRRGLVPVIFDSELHEADAYMPVIAVAADAPAWSLAHWQANHRARVLVEEAAAAADIRARLIAVRPN